MAMTHPISGLPDRKGAAPSALDSSISSDLSARDGGPDIALRFSPQTLDEARQLPFIRGKEMEAAPHRPVLPLFEARLGFTS